MKLNHIITSVLTGSAILFAGCSEKLNIPQHSVSEINSYYKTDAEAEEGIIACYDEVRALENGLGSGMKFVKTHLSDDVWSGGGSHYDGTFYMLSDYTFSADYSAISTLYENLYKLVYRSNVVLERVTGTSDAMKRIVAEARVFRAYAYFNLTIMWGTPPLIDHTLNEDEYMQGNSTTEALWAFIEEDLKQAINSGSLTQKTGVNAGTYRITKQYAQALLGKSYVFQKKWQEAATVLKEVINSKLYALNPDMSNIETPLGGLTSESVFEIVQMNDRNVSTNNNLKWTMMGLRGEKYSYGESSPFATATWGYQNPRKDLYDAFVAVEGKDGYRLKNVIATFERMEKEFQTVPIMDVTDNEGYWNLKQRILKSQWAGYFYANNDRIMRYNEVLLLAAEACLQSGDAASATAYINEIRTRAQAPLINGTVSMDQIKTESRLELCFEGQRYENLIRWGDAASALAKNGEKNPILHPDGTVGWESFNSAGKCGFKTGKHELLPFPSNEVMVNSNIQQNPNW